MRPWQKNLTQMDFIGEMMSNYTQEEERLMLMSPLETKEDMQAWIHSHMGIELPDQIVSRFANSTPLDFAWECYRAIIDGTPLSIMGLSGRDSTKTLTLGVIDVLAFLHDKRDTVHIAMTQAQGQRAKAYIEGFINKNKLMSGAVVKQNSKNITMLIDGEEVGMELIPATPKAVQGAHCSLLTFDELASSMEPSNVRAVKDAAGIVGTSRTGKSAVVIKITSRQSGHSLAEAEIKRGKTKVVSWTTLENTERCPDSRSGTEMVPLWINHIRGEVYTEEEFDLMDPGKKDGFYIVDTMREKCRNCPLASLCQSDLKNQTFSGVTLRNIDDVITKLDQGGSQDWALAQLMSLKPSSDGSIYWEWDRKIHVPGWNKMWEILTGMSSSALNINREMFINELKKRGAQFYCGIDWGFNPSPSIALVMAVDNRGYMYVVEAIAKIKMNDGDFIEDILRNGIQIMYDIQMYCPDLANASGRDMLVQAGLPTTDEIDKTVNMGISLVKSVLRVPGTNGKTRVFFAPDLDKNLPKKQNGEEQESIFDEFELYHKKTDKAGRVLDMDDPAKEYDHFMDSIRYLVYWLVGRKKGNIVYSDDMTSMYPKENKKERTSNIPSNKELLRQQGINFIDTDGDSSVSSGDDGQNDPPEAGGPIWSWT